MRQALKHLRGPSATADAREKDLDMISCREEAVICLIRSGETWLSSPVLHSNANIRPIDLRNQQRQEGSNFWSLQRFLD